MFYKRISNKRKAKYDLHPSSAGGGNTVTKIKKKAKVLNAFFASVCNIQTCSLGTQSPEQKTETGSRIRPPKFKDKGSDVLHHLDPHKSMGSTKGSEGKGGSAH